MQNIARMFEFGLRKNFVRKTAYWMHPVRVFIALLLTVTFWLAPILLHLGRPPIARASNDAQLNCEPGTMPGEVLGFWECRNYDNMWDCDANLGNANGYCGTANSGYDGDEPNKECWKYYTTCVPIPYPPPNISGVLTCAQPGNDGWCISGLSLDLTASDAPQFTLLIHILYNGIDVVADPPAGPYSLPIQVEGEKTATFTAYSSSGHSTSSSVVHKLDGTAPQLSGTLNGASGLNDWLITSAVLELSAADGASGVKEIRTSLDNGTTWTTYTAPITLTDGIYNFLIQAEDNAGNVIQDTKTIKVDTLAPVVNVSMNGVMGLNSWYVSNVDITATATDPSAGSGQATGSKISAIEMNIDNGGWKPYAPVTLSDGLHTFQFRAQDNAGNLTETAPQSIQVDALAPIVNLAITGTYDMDGYYVTDTEVAASVSDPSTGSTGSPQAGSGIASLEASQNGAAYAPYGGPLRFSNGWHTYQFKATDKAGNITDTGVLTMNVDTTVINPKPRAYQPPPSMVYQAPIPTAAPIIPTAIAEVAIVPTSAPALVAVEPPKVVTLKPLESVTVSWTKEPASPVIPPISNSTILWGAAATAAVGYFLAETKKQREEEALRKIEAAREAREVAKEQLAATREDNGGGGIQKKQPIKLKNLWNANGAAIYAVNQQLKAAGIEMNATTQAQAIKDATTNGRFDVNQYTGNLMEAKRVEEKMAKQEAQDEAAWTMLQTAQEAQRKAKEESARQEEARQKVLEDFRTGERADNPVLPATPAPTTRWSTALDWIDAHQPGLSLGVGIGIGIITAIVVLATLPITLPVVAGAAAVAAVTAGVAIAAGTVALNNNYGRSPTTNIVPNILYAAGGAIAGSVVTLTIAALPMILNGIGGYCAVNPAVCSRVDFALNAIDKLEEAGLVIKGSYQTAIGDSQGAADTALELQLEYMDGGMPGNSALHEASEQLAELGDDVPELIATYGDDIIPLLLKYREDAVDIIGAYGKEGIALLQKFGDDAPQAIKLAKEFGTPAVRLLDTVNVQSAESLLRNLKPDVLDYAAQQGPDAVKALSKWKPEELKKFGVELALRADKDAKAINALHQLTKLDFRSADPKVQAEVNRLIQEIADNSTHGSGNRFVLGSWDLEKGIAGGYINDARLNGGYYYGSHPDIYNIVNDLYGKSDPNLKNDILWSLNQAALQKQIEKGVDFDYALASIKDITDYNKEVEYVELIESGNVAEVLKMLEGKPLPARLKEVQLLLDAGYTPDYDNAAYDNAAHVIRWTLEP